MLPYNFKQTRTSSSTTTSTTTKTTTAAATVTHSVHILISIILCTIFFIKDVASVRVVALHVPSSVRTGAEVELACLYELGNSSLYSLKWFYRASETDLDEQEFFRYTPSIRPHKQYFPIEGINVNVNKSEGGRVVLTETNGKTSGKYKCEISIEGTFQTVAAEKLMTVNDAPSTFWDDYLPNSIKYHLPGGGGGGGGGGAAGRSNSGAAALATYPPPLSLLLLLQLLSLVFTLLFTTTTTKPNYQLTSGT